jgi:hypothetical protein
MNSRLQLKKLRIGRRWLWGGMLNLLLIVVQPITCFSLEIRRVQSCSGPILRLRGDIKAGDFSQLKSHFRGKEVIIGFDLSSLGGDLEDGLRIANLTRRKKLTVYVAGECSSACADVFIAAAKRFFGEESKIGVHAVSNSRDIEDAGSKLQTIKLARFWAKQGVPNSTIRKMVTTRPEEITYLDRADLSGLQASAGNPFAYEVEKLIETPQAPEQSCAARLDAGSGVKRKLVLVQQKLLDRGRLRGSVQLKWRLT